MKDRVMVDIETLGLEPGSVLLSIGAVKFDRRGIKDELHINVSRESCREAGLTEDAETLDWWEQQPDEITGVLTGGAPLTEALEALAGFYGESEEVWANAPIFDVAHLEQCYDAVGIVEPWEYWETRDCRTLASLPQWPDWEQEGNEHDALHDARHQTKQTVRCLREIHD